MHNLAMEMGRWAMNKANQCGLEKLTSQDWDDLKDCMEAVKCAICADKDYRIIKAMDEAEEEEKILDKLGVRAGYDRYRYADGRFAPKGHGTRRGYTPYLPMEPDEWINAYLNNPDFVDKNYRMGYHGDKGVYSTPSNTERFMTDIANIVDIITNRTIRSLNIKWKNL